MPRVRVLDVRVAVLVVAFLAVGVVATVGLSLANAGWPGEADACTEPGGNCYCEAVAATPGESLVKQPANTWSNLAPLAVGLAILASAPAQSVVPQGQARRPSRSLGMSAGWHVYTYGLLVMGLALGSMAFHASLTRVGGWLDTLSMIAFITYVLVYESALIRGLAADRSIVLGGFVLATAALALVTWLLPGTGTLVFTVLVLTGTALELALSVRGINGVIRPAWPWLIATLVTFGIAALVWRLSWSGAPLCDPSSPLQGHAIWHVLAEAVVPVLLLRHLRQLRSA